MLTSRLVAAFVALFLAAGSAEAQEAAVSPVYKYNPDWEAALYGIPDSYQRFYDNFTSYDWQTYALVGGITAGLFHYDQKIVNWTVSYTTRHHLLKAGAQEQSVAKFQIIPGKTEDIRLPTNLTGVYWYFGDALFSFSLAGGLLGYGYLNGSVHAANVGLEILQSMVIAGPVVIGLKMITGRESPSKAERKGGKWHGFPGFTNYAKNQSRYYAYPSGHVTAAVSTLTVMAENYAEHAWIAPVGGVMVGILGATLMNVGAHWPSDFPLAVLIGYTSAHTVVMKNKELNAARRHDIRIAENKWRWDGATPVAMDQGYGLGLNWSR